MLLIVAPHRDGPQPTCLHIAFTDPLLSVIPTAHPILAVVRPLDRRPASSGRRLSQSSQAIRRTTSGFAHPARQSPTDHQNVQYGHLVLSVTARSSICLQTLTRRPDHNTGQDNRRPWSADITPRGSDLDAIRVRQTEACTRRLEPMPMELLGPARRHFTLRRSSTTRTRRSANC